MLHNHIQLLIIPLIVGLTLLAVLEAITPVVDWPYLGLALGIEKYQLDIIENENRGKVKDCKKAMISLWLDTADNTSWQCLVKALQSPLVEETSLADDIAMKYL